MAEHTAADPPAVQRATTVTQALDLVGLGRYQHLLLLYCGVAWAADACETMLLSYLGPSVACAWPADVGPAGESALTSVVFAGMLGGVYCLGAVADAFGRRRGFLASAVLLGAAGLASAAAPSFGVSGALAAGAGMPARPRCRFDTWAWAPPLPRHPLALTPPSPCGRPAALPAVAAGGARRGGHRPGRHPHRGHPLCRVCSLWEPRRLAAGPAGLLDGGHHGGGGPGLGRASQVRLALAVGSIGDPAAGAAAGLPLAARVAALAGGAGAVGRGGGRAARARQGQRPRQAGADRAAARARRRGRAQQRRRRRRGRSAAGAAGAGAACGRAAGGSGAAAALPPCGARRGRGAAPRLLAGAARDDVPAVVHLGGQRGDVLR
jgi:hypothetical protein